MAYNAGRDGSRMAHVGAYGSGRLQKDEMLTQKIFAVRHVQLRAIAFTLSAFSDLARDFRLNALALHAVLAVRRDQRAAPGIACGLLDGVHMRGRADNDAALVLRHA